MLNTHSFFLIELLHDKTMKNFSMCVFRQKQYSVKVERITTIIDHNFKANLLFLPQTFITRLKCLIAVSYQPFQYSWSEMNKCCTCFEKECRIDKSSIQNIVVQHVYSGQRLGEGLSYEIYIKERISMCNIQKTVFESPPWYTFAFFH